MISKVKYESFLLIIALVFYLVVVYLMQISDQTIIFGDTNSYVLAAKQLYIEGKLNDHRPLVISLINGFPLLFSTQEKYLFVWSLLINTVSWLSTILFLFYTAKEWIAPKKAFLFALTYIFFIGNLFIVFHLLSETLYIFFLVLFFYFITLFYKYKNSKSLVYSCCLLLLMTMIKPFSVGLLYVFIWIYRKDLKLIVRFKNSVTISLCLAILGVQLVQMKRQYGTYTISYIDGVTYYDYLGTKADCLKKNIAFVQGKNERVKRIKYKTLMEMKVIAKEDFEAQITNNTYNLFKAYILNGIDNATHGSASVHGCINQNNTSYFDIFSYLFKGLSKIQNILFTSLGLLISIAFIFMKTPKPIKFTSLTLTYIIAVSAISSDQGDRFHIVIYPLLLILLIYAYSSWMCKESAKTY